jgi:hypothetical protein
MKADVWVNTMADKPKHSGLCETCERDAICTLRRSTRLEIILCEEHILDEAGLAPQAQFEYSRPAAGKKASGRTVGDHSRFR